MKMEEKIEVINDLTTDYKAEVVAAGLIEAGLPSEKLLILRDGGNRRHISKDISKVETQYYNFDQSEYLQIHTTRYNIYDALPEGIFHTSMSSRKQSKEEILLEIRNQQKEEFFARRFFKPFEISIDKLLIESQLFERKFDKKNVTRNLTDIFIPYWPFLKLLSLRQTVFFIKIIPIIQQIINKFEMVSQVVSLILDVPIKVCQGKKRRLNPETTFNVKLGNCRLGISTVLENDFEDGYRSINVEVGPVTPSQMKSFEFGATSDLVLKELFKIILPFDCQINIKYETIHEHSAFRISGDDHTTYLGINTNLN